MSVCWRLCGTGRTWSVAESHCPAGTTAVGAALPSPAGLVAGRALCQVPTGALGAALGAGTLLPGVRVGLLVIISGVKVAVAAVTAHCGDKGDFSIPPALPGAGMPACGACGPLGLMHRRSLNPIPQGCRRPALFWLKIRLRATPGEAA